MKRLLCLCCCVWMLTACGDRTPLPVWNGFSCTVTAVYGDAVYVARLDRTDAQKTSLVFSSPAVIEGLVAERSGDRLRLIFEEEQHETDVASSLQAALINVLVDVLDVDGPRQTPQNGVVEGETCGTPYRLCYDRVNGHLTSLKVESLSLSVEFSNFVENDSEEP